MDRSQQHYRELALLVLGAGVVVVSLLIAQGVSRKTSVAPNAPESVPNASSCYMEFVVPAVGTPDPTASPTPTATPAGTIPPGSTPTPTPTVTPSPTPDPNIPRSLKLRVRFSGVNQDRGSITARVSFGAIGNSTYLRTTTITFSHYSGSVYEGIWDRGIEEPLVSPMWLTVKGEKHLQRVFSDLRPTTNFQVFDFSSKLMEVGDIGIQDGVVNLQDMNMLIAITAKPVKTIDDLRIADLNYDGVVNSADFNAILSTLSTRPDELVQ